MCHYFSDIMKDKQNNKKIFSHLHFLYIPFMFFPYSKFLARLICTHFLHFFSAHFFLKPLQSLFFTSFLLFTTVPGSRFSATSPLLYSSVRIHTYLSPPSGFSLLPWLFEVLCSSFSFFYTSILHVGEPQTEVLVPSPLTYFLVKSSVSELILALSPIEPWHWLNLYLQPRPDPDLQTHPFQGLLDTSTWVPNGWLTFSASKTEPLISPFTLTTQHLPSPS